MSEFEDIKIVDFDDTATTPSGKGALLNMHLKLSKIPPVDWTNLFEMNWKNYFSMSKREVYCGHGELIVVCLEDELQQQIDALKPIISSTNDQYKSRLLAQQEIAEREEAKKKAQQEKLAEIKKNLTF